tara:strand:+ start:84 stop:428 length:345 start_codon:yes stop_codon:yes gene_type:complete
MRDHHPPAPETLMELEQIMMLVERIGLPAVIIGIMCYYIMQTQKAHREEIIRWENKDTLGDERLIDVINKQNERSEHVATALNDLTISNKDVAKSHDRLADKIHGMTEAIIRSK